MAPADRRRALVVGDPRAEPQEGFPPLPGAEDESVAVAERLSAAGYQVTHLAGDFDLHRIVVVGGGAGGLRARDQARRQASGARQGAQSPWSIAPAPICGSRCCTRWRPAAWIVDEHELDYLAQAHWHHFRYRYRRDDRPRSGQRRDPARARPTTRTAGRSRRAQRSATTRWSSPSAASPTISARRACRSTRSRSTRPGPGGAVQPAPGQRVPARPRPERAGAARPAARRDHRRRRDRHRAVRPSCIAPRGRWSPTGSTGSIRRRTSRSP